MTKRSAVSGFVHISTGDLPLLSSPQEIRSLSSEFDTFWKAFPRKVGKLAAEKAYARARKRATAEQLLAGVEVYRRTKPAYADWCHPTTWLTQGRWLDEVAEPSGHRPFVCPHSPTCNGRNACRVLQELGR